MTDADRGHQNESTHFHPPSVVNTPAASIFIVALLGALGAAGAVYGLGDLIGLGVAVAIGVAGAGVAAFAAGKPPAPADAKVTALLQAVSAEDASPEPPSRFRGEPWATLYRHAAGYAEAQRSATLAVQEAERLRSELEQKPAAPPSFEPRPAHADHELVGGGADDRNAVDQNAEVAARVRQALAEAVTPISQGLAAIENELEPLRQSLQAAGSSAQGAPNGHPAKMVDALVRTAADGIEDLAAGLMRANELAIVAERVTNRATLLALNAALEATRSGSEAFASIAEETRRLAEYAREATDTISRLSNEIEMKVGETIGNIQSSSEDAKAALDSIRTGGTPSRAVAPETIRALESLVGRVRSLRQRAEAVVAPSVAEVPESEGRAPYVPPTSPSLAGAPTAFQDSESAGSHAPPDASAPDEPASMEESESAPVWSEVAPVPAADPSPGDSHDSFASRPIGDSDDPSALGSAEGSAENVSEESADASSSAMAESSPSAESSEPSESPESPESPTPGASPAGAPKVVEKIPDWLEGIGPRDKQ